MKAAAPIIGGMICPFTDAATSIAPAFTAENPVLFITGEHDQIFPARMIRDSADRVRGSQFVEIPDAGHSPYFEQPAAWNAALLEFLSAIDKDRST